MNIVLKKTLLFIVAAGSILCLLFFSDFSGSSYSKSLSSNLIQSDSILLASNTPPPSPKLRKADNKLLERLKIPVIKVDAAIESLGLTTAGAMDVPKGPEDVAWFNQGPRPGEVGSAVIAGHFDWKNGKAAVFNKLSKLRKGDKLYIQNVQGKSLAFVVREIRIYDSEADAPEVFLSAQGAHLNLVTCAGPWNKSKKSYTKRLVVFTDRIQ